MAEEIKPEETGKTEKSFNEALNKLSIIIGGKDKLIPKKKVKGTDISDIVGEITKERVEKNRTETKVALVALLENYVLFKQEVEAKKKEFDILVEKKQKEFTETAHKFFAKIEGSDAYVKSMEDALTAATAAITS